MLINSFPIFTKLFFLTTNYISEKTSNNPIIIMMKMIAIIK